MDTTTEVEPAEQPTLPTWALWGILLVVMLASALDLIDSTITNIAAPTITGELHGGNALIKWLGAAYSLAMGVLLVAGGRLGDKFGQRRMFLIGMAGFTVASALAGFSPDSALLVVARVLQGGFGALMIPQGVAIMTKTFPPKMKTTAFSIYGPVLGLAGVGGPILAGFLIDANIAGATWRPIFLINLALGAAGLAAAYRLLPRTTAADQDNSVVVDGWGASLLAVAMFGSLFGLIEGSTNGWDELPIVAVCAGAVFFVFFAYRQKTAPEPLIRPSLLRNKRFTSGVLVGLAVFASTSGLLYVLSLFMQEGMHESPRGAALGLVPMTVGIIAASGACVGLLPKLGRNLVFIGILMLLGGCIWFYVLIHHSGTDLGLWNLAGPMFATGLGMGACYTTVFNVALGDVSAAEAGSASGSIASIQQLANGIGSAVVTTVFFQTISGGLAHAAQSSLIVVLIVAGVAFPVVALMPRKAAAELEH
ncbi:MFS transporter [Catenulispora pinisilvae]|uniref:MFS transporter n=1 Tax=Catenulispora pinisilvae TaxID=2705253 RepID=UPI001891222C|nr:MFS transporter [Catenulispora pinisilvae]